MCVCIQYLPRHNAQLYKSDALHPNRPSYPLQHTNTQTTPPPTHTPPHTNILLTQQGQFSFHHYFITCVSCVCNCVSVCAWLCVCGNFGLRGEGPWVSPHEQNNRSFSVHLLLFLSSSVILHSIVLSSDSAHLWSCHSITRWPFRQAHNCTLVCVWWNVTVGRGRSGRQGKEEQTEGCVTLFLSGLFPTITFN